MSKLNLLPSLKARERKRWALTSNPAMSQEQAIVCPYVKCGKIFSEPIELTVRAEGSLETYYACPHCFSRVSLSDNSEEGPSKVPHGALRDASKNIKKDDAVKFYARATYIQTLYLEEQTRR